MQRGVAMGVAYLSGSTESRKKRILLLTLTVRRYGPKRKSANTASPSGQIGPIFVA